jgi:hypothetical protein
MLSKIVADHRAGTANHGELIWLLANVYLWHDRAAA